MKKIKNENIKIINDIKKQFPILKTKINGKKLIYLDNAAMTQMPKTTIDELTYIYSNINSNIHRSAYKISEISTEKYEETREKIKIFLNAKDDFECMFVKNTTEGINLIAQSYVKNFLQENDEIIISEMEHHSNIVPWYLICEEKKAKLKTIPLLKSGDLDYNKISSLINNKTKFISITHISNSIGTINDIKYVIKIAKQKKIQILIDGAQSLAHNINLNLKELDCDFFVFSSHKIYGPNGLGFLFVKNNIIKSLSPYQGGGDMIKYVDFNKIEWNDPPYKFEAGTQSIANIIAFSKTIDFLKNIDFDLIKEHKKNLLNYALNELQKIKDLTIIGNPNKRSEIISFTLKGVHPHDLGTIANNYGIAIRTGHHCTMPIMKFYDITGTSRLSFGIYNNITDIKKLISCIKISKKIFK